MTTQRSGRRKIRVDTCESLAADLAVLTNAIDDPDIDLDTELRAFIAATKLAIASYLGMSLTMAVDGHEVSITVDDHGATPILTSLLIPLPAVSSAEGASTLTLYAATPGAFVDLAADLSYGLALPDAALVLDEHLAPNHGPGVTGLDSQRAFNQAIGVLLERGHTPESAREELSRLDTGDLHATAEQILHTGPICGPDHDR